MARVLTPYFPVYLDLKNKEVLIIGDGDLALEKINALVQTGCKIVVVSEHPTLALLSHQNQIILLQQPFSTRMISSRYTLVYGATGESKFNQKIAKLCEKKRILFNGVDDPAHCHFLSSAIFRRGKLTLAVSTSGASPYLAKGVIEILEKTLGDEYTVLTEWLHNQRPKVAKLLKTAADRKEFWGQFFAIDLVQLAKKKGEEGLESRLTTLLKKKKIHDS